MTKSVLNAIQLRDVQDALRKPLSGRHVLIPLGSKAFVPGELRPKMNEQQQEMVQIRQRESGELKTIPRKEAIDFIQQDIQALKPLLAKKKKAPPTKSSSDTKPSSKSPIDTKTISISDANPTGNTVSPNFFEIREEIDDQGREVHSEAVNITDHLKLWEEQVNAANKTGSTSEMTEASENSLVENKEIDNGENYEEIETDHMTTGVETKNKVSDAEFAAISARLEELARLEEEEEARLVESHKSSKRLQSKGWTKGFLNKSSKPVAKQRVAPPITAPRTREVVETPTSPGSNKVATGSDSSLREAGVGTAGCQSKSRSGSGRSVGFSDSNQVREIPRVGQKSVIDIQKSVKAIHDSVVTDIVRERPRKGRQQNQSNISTENNTQPQKKLSRFAQQRMGQS